MLTTLAYQRMFQKQGQGLGSTRRGFADEGVGHAEPALHAARIGTRALAPVGARVQVDACEPVVDLLRPVGWGDAAKPGKEGQVLGAGELAPQEVLLRAHAHGRLDGGDVVPRVELGGGAAEHGALRGRVHAAEHVDRRALARAIGAEQP